MTFSTARLRLRPFVPTDRAWLHPITSDPVVTRHTDWGPNTVDDTTDFLADASTTGTGPSLVGPAHQSAGYGTEVAAALVARAFDVHGVRRVEATCHPDNAALARVLEKTGLLLEGRMRSHLLVRDTWRDSLLWAALDTDPRPAGH